MLEIGHRQTSEKQDGTFLKKFWWGRGSGVMVMSAQERSRKPTVAMVLLCASH